MPPRRRRRTAASGATAAAAETSAFPRNRGRRIQRRSAGVLSRRLPRTSDGSTPYASMELKSNDNLMSLEFGNRGDVADQIHAKISDSTHVTALKYLIPAFKKIQPRKWSMETLDKGMKVRRWLPQSTSPSSALKHTVEDAIRYSIDQQKQNQKRAKRYSGAAVTRRYLREAGDSEEMSPMPYSSDNNTGVQATNARDSLLHETPSKRQKNHDAQGNNDSIMQGDDTATSFTENDDVTATPRAEESGSAAAEDDDDEDENESYESGGASVEGSETKEESSAHQNAAHTATDNNNQESKNEDRPGGPEDEDDDEDDDEEEEEEEMEEEEGVEEEQDTFGESDSSLEDGI